MKISTLLRHFREGFKNLGRNAWLTLASIVSVMVTLFILGVFLLLAFNVNHMADHLERQVEIRAFVDSEVPLEIVQSMQAEIEEYPLVSEVALIDRMQAIDELIAGMGDEGRYYEEYRSEENNPLPYTLVIQTVDPQDTPEVAAQVEQIEHVYNLNYGGGTTELLFSAINLMRNIGIVLIIGLALTAMLLIANTIKVTIGARAKEIEIMKLVGAKNSFVRWPFFIEGSLLGMIGAVIPAVILVLGYEQLLIMAEQYVHISFVQLVPTYPIVIRISVLLVLIGGLIGMWGSLISIRRYLRV